MLGEAFLSFLGLGINPPKASWGTLAQDGYTAYQSHPYIIVIPSVAIAWLILSAFFIADGLRDALDPRTKEAWVWRYSRSRTSARTSRPARARCTPSTASASRSRKGKMLGIVGESGCGKSVTALSIMGLLVQTAGRIVCGAIRFEGPRADEDVRQARARGRPRAADRDDLPGSDDVAEPDADDRDADHARRSAATSGCRRTEADKRAIELLEEVHIPNASGGSTTTRTGTPEGCASA